jgi:hypothetical protein
MEQESKQTNIIKINNNNVLYKNREEKKDELQIQLEIEKLKLTGENSYIEELKLHVEQDNNNRKKIFSDKEFWDGIMSNPNNIKNFCEYLLNEFGTKEPCNRFDVGNSIEFIISDYIKTCGFKVLELPNTKRFDIDVDNYKKLSIKYSSTGDITLHNSNSSINKDIEMKDTILLTPDNLYLITDTELCKNNINIKDYIKNCGDSLKLKRTILKELKKINYPYIYEINIKHNKKNCKNRLCSKIFYDKLKEEYISSLK